MNHSKPRITLSPAQPRRPAFRRAIQPFSPSAWNALLRMLCALGLFASTACGTDGTDTKAASTADAGASTDGTIADGTIADGTIADGTIADGTIADGTIADAATLDTYQPPPSTLGKSPAVCGAKAYAWLPTAATLTAPGHLLWHEEITDFDFTATSLSAVLSAVGVKLPLTYTHDVRVFRVRYTTQDRGELTEATGFVALPIPVKAGDPLELDLLAYLHGSAGYVDKCAPSAKMLDPVAGAALASVGHVVVAPDYIGLKASGAPSGQLHPYLIDEATAIASFDAVRAARELVAKQLVKGLTLRPGIFVLGGSQGGHAALAMDAYGFHYAPDEPIVAIAASVPMLDLIGEGVRATQSKILGTENLASMLAVAADWYGLALATAIQPERVAAVLAHLQSKCTLSGILGSAKGPSEMFTSAFMQAAAGDLEGDDPWSCALRHNCFAHDAVKTPIPAPTLVVLAESDELLDDKLQRAAYDARCARGEPVRFLACAGMGHTAGALASLPEQLDFLHARRAGKPMTGSCQSTPPIKCSGDVKL